MGKDGEVTGKGWQRKDALTKSWPESLVVQGPHREMRARQQPKPLLSAGGPPLLSTWASCSQTSVFHTRGEGPAPRAHRLLAHRLCSLTCEDGLAYHFMASAGKKGLRKTWPMSFC